MCGNVWRHFRVHDKASGASDVHEKAVGALDKSLQFVLPRLVTHGWVSEVVPANMAKTRADKETAKQKRA